MSMAAPRRLHFIPVTIFLWMPVTFVITYAIAVQLGHVYPFFPTISDTGTYPPESCFFSMMLNVSVFLLVFATYIRHRQVSCFSVYRPRDGPCRLNNTLSTILGLFACLGLDLVANFQETSVLAVHAFGAMLCFWCANLYFIIQTIFSYWMVPEMNSIFMVMLRALLSIIALFFNVTAQFAQNFFSESLSANQTIGDTLQWDPSMAGWGWHVTATISEWCLALSLGLFVLSFYPDFRRITIDTPIVKFPGLPKIQNGWAPSYRNTTT